MHLSLFVSLGLQEEAATLELWGPSRWCLSQCFQKTGWEDLRVELIITTKQQLPPHMHALFGCSKSASTDWLVFEGISSKD